MERQRQMVVEALLELSDETLQRRRWLSSGEGEVSSFTEAVCELFDDSGLGHELDRGRAVFGAEVDDFLRRFGTTLRDLGRLDRSLPPATLIAHPEMVAARAFAKAILVQISHEPIDDTDHFGSSEPGGRD
jgi:hypothetical protein